MRVGAVADTGKNSTSPNNQLGSLAVSAGSLGLHPAECAGSSVRFPVQGFDLRSQIPHRTSNQSWPKP